MNKYMILTVGFERPTPAIMKAWEEWFAGIKDGILDRGGFMRGCEISKSGTIELAMDRTAITGYVVVNAESFDDALRMAGTNPYVSSVRVYEMRSH